MLVTHEKTIKTMLALLCSKLLSWIKLSWVIGSAGICFSASNLCMPLTGLFGGAGIATILWTLMLGMRLMTGTWQLSTLTFYIPGYCAALYLATRQRVLRTALPLVCIVLFVIHPVGFQAMLYSTYWLIPLIIAQYRHAPLFMHMLAATFTAHAVGSVIWLYTVPMTPTTWLALMPLVALERCTYAAGMFVIYHAIVWLYNKLSVCLRMPQHTAHIHPLSR